MDLKEAENFKNSHRHPWELSRLDSLRKILNGTIADGQRVLDLGCGDGFISRELFKGTGVMVTAIDSNFQEKHLEGLAGLDQNITYSKSIKGQDRFGLVLLLDVIEHVDTDSAFLKKIVNERLANGGRVLITVPAFNALFSGHDAFLGHRRRYSLGELSDFAEKAGLKVVSSGYLFSSLLLPRAFTAACEKFLGARKRGKGLGDWKHGRTITFLVKKALDIDNALSIALNRSLGIKIPGLTGWALCERRL